MTVSTTQNRKEYACNGVTTDFEFPYYFLEDADLVVLRVTVADGTETLLSLGTDYTVSGAGDAAGGTVTTTSTYSSDYELVIYRDPAVTQGMDLVENDPLPAGELEKAYDRLTMIDQRDREILGRSLRLPEGDTGFDDADQYLPSKSSRASKFLGFDADGKPVARDSVTGGGTAADYDVGTDPDQVPTNADLGTAASRDVGTAADEVPTNALLGAPPRTVASIAELRALEVMDRPVQVLSYHDSNVFTYSGGGLFVWDAASADADNGGTVIRPANIPAEQAGRWRAQYSGRIDARRFGLRARDGATTYAAENLDAMDRLTAACQAWEIVGGEYVIGGDIGIAAKSEIFIGSDTTVRLGDNASIRHARINNQDTARRTGLFVFEPTSTGSVFTCYGVLDGNQEAQPQDSQGRNTATSAVFVWHARVHFKGDFYCMGASAGLHLIDADYSTIETVRAETDVEGEIEGMTVLVLEGCEGVHAERVIGRNVTEVVDLNNRCSFCAIDLIYGDNVSEEVADINGSYSCEFKEIVSINSAKTLMFNESAPRYTNKVLPVRGFHKFHSIKVFIDDNNVQPLSNPLIHHNNNDNSRFGNVFNVDMQITGTGTAQLPERLILLDEVNQCDIYIYVRSLVAQDITSALVINRLSYSRLLFQCLQCVKSGNAIVDILSTRGNNTIINATAAQTSTGGTKSGRIGFRINASKYNPQGVTRIINPYYERVGTGFSNVGFEAAVQVD